MYKLECSYFQDAFPTLEELIDHVLTTGMDPGYHVLRNGKRIGMKLEEFLDL